MMRSPTLIGKSDDFVAVRFQDDGPKACLQNAEPAIGSPMLPSRYTPPSAMRPMTARSRSASHREAARRGRSPASQAAEGIGEWLVSSSSDLGLVVRRDLISRIDELHLGERSYREAAVAFYVCPRNLPTRTCRFSRRDERLGGIVRREQVSERLSLPASDTSAAKGLASEIRDIIRKSAGWERGSRRRAPTRAGVSLHCRTNLRSPQLPAFGYTRRLVPRSPA